MFRMQTLNLVLCPVLCVVVISAPFEAALPQTVGKPQQSQLIAKRSRPEVRTKSSRARIQDVRMQAGDVLPGRVVDAQGKAVNGEVVTVEFGKNVFGRTATNARGQFRIRIEKGGLYRISTSKGSTFVRVWPGKVAPKNASDEVVVVRRSRVVRGQDLSQLDLIPDVPPGGELLIFGGLATGLGIGIADAVSDKSGN